MNDLKTNLLNAVRRGTSAIYFSDVTGEWVVRCATEEHPRGWVLEYKVYAPNTLPVPKTLTAHLHLQNLRRQHTS